MGVAENRRLQLAESCRTAPHLAHSLNRVLPAPRPLTLRRPSPNESSTIRWAKRLDVGVVGG
jgi:hypothetical protein